MGNGFSRECCNDLFMTERQKQRSAARSQYSDRRQLSLSLSSPSLHSITVTEVPRYMDNAAAPQSSVWSFQMDHTTSTPCISTLSSSLAASSNNNSEIDIFEFDPFSEPFKTEARVIHHRHQHQQQTPGERQRRTGCSLDCDMDPFSSASLSGLAPPSACSTFTEDQPPPAADEQHQMAAAETADGTWTSSAGEAMTTGTVDSKDMAFVLTESSEALAPTTAADPADAEDDGPATQPRADESDGHGETDAPPVMWFDFDDDVKVHDQASGKGEDIVSGVDGISDKNEATTASQKEDEGTAVVGGSPTSPETGNGYALTDVIDDLMAAEFPETTAPQADSEEVVLLSPTPPTLPPVPAPPANADHPSGPEVDKAEVAAVDIACTDQAHESATNGDAEHVDHGSAAGHQGSHEPRVTLSGPLQFMGRNDLPRDDLTPPTSPVASPVKLLDVLPASLRDAAASEALLARSVPVTSGSIDAVTADDTQSTGETSNVVDDQREVFDEPSTAANGDSGDTEDKCPDEMESNEQEMLNNAASTANVVDNKESEHDDMKTNLSSSDVTEPPGPASSMVAGDSQRTSAELPTSVPVGAPSNGFPERIVLFEEEHFDEGPSRKISVGSRYSKQSESMMNLFENDEPGHGDAILLDAHWPWTTSRQEETVPEVQSDGKTDEIQTSADAPRENVNILDDTGDRKVLVEADLDRENNSNIDEQYETEEHAKVTRSDDEVCEVSGNDVADKEVTDDDDLTTNKAADISKDAKDEVSPPGKEVVERQLNYMDGSCTLAEPSNIETTVKVERVDSATGDIASAVTADVLTKAGVDVQSSATIALGDVDLELTGNDELGATDESGLQSRSMEEDSVEEVSEPVSALPAKDPDQADAAETDRSGSSDDIHRDKLEIPVLAASAVDAATDAAGDGREVDSPTEVTQIASSSGNVIVEEQAAVDALMDSICIQCGKKVYEMEKIIADQVVYHKTCFRCSHCSRVLSIANFASMEGHIFCKPHFMEIFMTKGTHDDDLDIAKEVDIAPYFIGDYGDRRPLSLSDPDAVSMVPLETVKELYEKLSREAAETQSTRSLPERRYGRQEQSVIDDTKEPSDFTDAPSNRVVHRMAAASEDGLENGRAVSAPSTPMRRPVSVRAASSPDYESIANELPQRGLTQTLVAQWREMEERARADLLAGLKTGASRSRSLSGLARRRGDSPSPSRRLEQGRSDDDSDVDEWNALEEDAGEQGRSGLVKQRRDIDDGEVEQQMPPPLMTQYMLAKFRGMEAETQVIAGLQAKDKKAFKWEVKQVTPLVRGMTAPVAAHGDASTRSEGHDARPVDDAAAPQGADEAEETPGDELPEPGTTRTLLAKFQSLETTSL